MSCAAAIYDGWDIWGPRDHGLTPRGFMLIPATRAKTNPANAGDRGLAVAIKLNWETSNVMCCRHLRWLESF